MAIFGNFNLHKRQISEAWNSWAILNNGQQNLSMCPAGVRGEEKSPEN